MSRNLTAALLALLLAASLRAADKPLKTPAGPQPVVLNARVDGDSHLLLNLVEFTPVLEERTMIVMTLDGKTSTKKVVKVMMIPKARTLRVGLRDLKSTDAAGNKLNIRVLRDRLKNEAPVLVSADGNPVDPFYLKAFKKETLVLIIPSYTPAVPTFGKPGKAPAGGGRKRIR